MRRTAAIALVLACTLTSSVVAAPDDPPAPQPISLETTGEAGTQQRLAMLSPKELAWTLGMSEFTITALALVARKNPGATGVVYMVGGPLAAFGGEAGGTTASKIGASAPFVALGIYHLWILSDKERSSHDRFWRSFTAGNLALTAPLLILEYSHGKGTKGKGPPTPEVSALFRRDSVGMSLRW